MYNSIVHKSRPAGKPVRFALLEREPERSGGRVLLLQVDHGSAKAPEVRGGSLHDTALESCLKRVLAGLKPAAAKGQATVKLLFLRE